MIQKYNGFNLNIFVQTKKIYGGLKEWLNLD